MRLFAQRIFQIVTTTLIVALCSFASSAQSVLSQGDWIQVSVTESGVYKITYDNLSSWGFSNIEQVSIYGNGAGELSLINSEKLPETLHEIAIWMEKGSDGIFNSGDYILFYGQSPNTWNYNYSTKKFIANTHSYETQNYYYITTSKAATKFITTTSGSLSPTHTVTTYDDLQAYEKNDVSPLSSGRERFESITGNNKTISFATPNAVTSEECTVDISIAARHSKSCSITVSANENEIGSIPFLSATTNKPYANLKTNSFTFLPTAGTNNIKITLNYSGATSRGYLNYCVLKTRCSLSISNDEQLIFRDSKNLSESAIGEFIISSNKENTVWDISNPEIPTRLSTQFSDKKTKFTAKTDSLREYVAFSSSFKTVDFEKKIENQDILSKNNIDMLIIANDIFAEYAQQLADLHEKVDKFSTAVISQEKICTEFSAGRKDIAAIRNYIRYLYEQGGKKLKYVLLFGDGIYNNADIDMNGSYIFTFQTKESLNEDYSLCSDDFFAILEPKKGVLQSDSFLGEVNVAIGRLPASTKTDAHNMTYKIIQYTTNPAYRGDWQNYLCFLADDANENQTVHMTDADQLCKSIQKNYPQFNFDKIFADAYEQVRSSAGERYPDVNKAVNNRIQKGCLIFNYSGHGNETRMMAEYAIEASAIESWKNTTKLPFFIGAACNTAHYDYSGTSIGEKLLAQKDGGGIGMISATRYSYASANYTLCDNIYKNIFELDSLGQIRTIGESFVLAKQSTNSDVYQNKRVYTLLGDPALRLAIPLYSIELDSINGIAVNNFEDTIKALSTLRISGHIADATNKILNQYNGTLSVKLFDKLQTITTLGNDNNDTYTFNSYTNILFQGLASIENGTFSFETIIPQDIYYYNGKGKLSLYATNDTTQAAGAFYDLIINGSNTSENDDFQGPKVSIFLNDSLSKTGMMSNQNPTIYVYAVDSSGINISNASIGHNIILTIDGDDTNPIVLNDFFYSDLNTYYSGSITYKLKDIEEGAHTLTLTIWDAYNNVTETTMDFYVVNSKNIKLVNLYNYPNPMKTSTSFHYEHNQADNEIKVTINIYDVSGNLVKSIQREKTPNGFIDNSITWDGKSSGGTPMQAGIYPYTIEIQTNTGNKLYGEQKILLVR